MSGYSTHCHDLTHARVAKGDALADAPAGAAGDLDADAAPSPFLSFGAGW
jgi:hypothetical protein